MTIFVAIIQAESTRADALAGVAQPCPALPCPRWGGLRVRHIIRTVVQPLDRLFLFGGNRHARAITRSPFTIHHHRAMCDVRCAVWLYADACMLDAREVVRSAIVT